MNYAAKWNKLDSVIFFCESKIKELKLAITESSEADPDPEVMILAETEHLRSENEKLRKREIPMYLIKDGEQYFCPKCRAEMPNRDIKYCSNCGHRVMKNIPNKNINIPYGIF